MSIFGWRKRQIADLVAADIEAAPQVPPAVGDSVEDSAINSEGAYYTVGMNPAGNTQLVMRLDYGVATLTMDSVGVRKLIRLLEATLPLDDGH